MLLPELPDPSVNPYTPGSSGNRAPLTSISMVAAEVAVAGAAPGWVSGPAAGP